MTRREYLRQVLENYLDSPDTPTKARSRDWAIATTFFQLDIDPATVAHAIRLATLRRHRRDPELDSLEPIHSLAYFRPLILHVHQNPHDPGYVEYIQWSYEQRLDWPMEEQGKQNRG